MSKAKIIRENLPASFSGTPRDMLKFQLCCCVEDSLSNVQAFLYWTAKYQPDLTYYFTIFVNMVDFDIWYFLTLFDTGVSRIGSQMGPRAEKADATWIHTTWTPFEGWRSCDVEKR